MSEELNLMVIPKHPVKVVGFTSWLIFFPYSKAGFLSGELQLWEGYAPWLAFSVQGL